MRTYPIGDQETQSHGEQSVRGPMTIGAQSGVSGRERNQKKQEFCKRVLHGKEKIAAGTGHDTYVSGRKTLKGGLILKSLQIEKRKRTQVVVRTGPHECKFEKRGYHRSEPIGKGRPENKFFPNPGP